MNPHNTPSTKKISESLCLEAIKSLSRNDLGETLSLLIATHMHLVKCDHELNTSEEKYRNKTSERHYIATNKLLALTGFGAYEALNHIQQSNTDGAIRCLTEVLDHYCIQLSRESFKYASHVDSDNSLEVAKQIAKNHKQSIKEVLRND